MHLVRELGLVWPKGDNQLANYFSLVSHPEPIWKLIHKIIHGNVDPLENAVFAKPQSCNHFNSIMGDLEQPEVIALLSSVIARSTTLTGMSKEAVQRKKTRNIQDYMIKDLGLTTWKEVRDIYPTRSQPVDVNQWLTLIRKQGVFTKTTRAAGWYDWITTIKSSNTLPHIAVGEGIMNKFSFAGCTYEMHNFDANQMYTLFQGTKQKNFGIFCYVYCYSQYKCYFKIIPELTENFPWAHGKFPMSSLKISHGLIEISHGLMENFPWTHGIFLNST